MEYRPCRETLILKLIWFGLPLLFLLCLTVVSWEEAKKPAVIFVPLCVWLYAIIVKSQLKTHSFRLYLNEHGLSVRNREGEIEGWLPWSLVTQITVEERKSLVSPPKCTLLVEARDKQLVYFLSNLSEPDQKQVMRQLMTKPNFRRYVRLTL